MAQSRELQGTIYDDGWSAIETELMPNNTAEEEDEQNIRRFKFLMDKFLMNKRVIEKEKYRRITKRMLSMVDSYLDKPCPESQLILTGHVLAFVAIKNAAIKGIRLDFENELRFGFRMRMEAPGTYHALPVLSYGKIELMEAREITAQEDQVVAMGTLVRALADRHSYEEVIKELDDWYGSGSGTQF